MSHENALFIWTPIGVRMDTLMHVQDLISFYRSANNYQCAINSFEGMGSPMRRALKSRPGISALVPKNHFASYSFFREEPLISWRFTKAVLFTAYDIYRSSDFWIDEVTRSGMTLKDGLIELGFPKRTRIIADTGIFELEAKKAGMAKDIGLPIGIELTNEQIFDAYEISGADYYISPDDIILPTDTKEIANKKISKIKHNMVELLEIVTADKVIGVLQGIEQDRIEELFDFYLSQGIDKFAMGGLLPLYRYDRTLLGQVLTRTRNLTKGYWLHAFGLPMVTLLPFYLQEIGMNSIDTSMLLYLTAKRRYLVDLASRPVRLADFNQCSCRGCKSLKEGIHPQHPDFFVNLYIHNIVEASRVAIRCTEKSWSAPVAKKVVTNQCDDPSVAPNWENRTKPLKDYGGAWVSASELLKDI